MNNKGIDIFCTSQARTAVCLNMDEASSSSPSSGSVSVSCSAQLGGGRAIDRHNPIIRDPKRISSSPLPPCSPRLPPPTPDKPHHNQQNRNKKICSKKKGSKPVTSDDQKRKNIAEPNGNSILTIRRQGWSCTKPGELISPPGSSRYLLGDPPFLEGPSEFDQLIKFVPIEAVNTTNNKSIVANKDEQFAAKQPSSRSPDQVVVLRVSLHCKGCERKMRKHISRMEGVSCFNIDFAAKKVTVVGDVTPLEVLASISKVKNAKLWMPPALPSSSA